MSYLQRKINDYSGISHWFNKQGLNTSPKYINNLMIEFLKSKNLEYQTFNCKYKGINTAELINAETVQIYFEEFIKFVKTKIINQTNND